MHTVRSQSRDIDLLPTDWLQTQRTRSHSFKHAYLSGTVHSAVYAMRYERFHNPTGLHVVKTGQSMSAERGRRNFRSPLIAISTTPAYRCATSRSTVFCHARSPLGSRSLDFRHAPLTCSETGRLKMHDLKTQDRKMTDHVN